MNKIAWEKLEEFGRQTAKLMVPGGWIIDNSSGICFYPDQEHKWLSENE